MAALNPRWGLSAITENTIHSHVVTAYEKSAHQICHGHFSITLILIKKIMKPVETTPKRLSKIS